VHQNWFVTKRLALALLAYAAIAVFAIRTLDDSRVRAVTLAILAMFALKSWLRRNDVLHTDSESGSDS
jgi:hypothetical protein